MKFLNAVLIVLIGHFSYAQKCVIVDKDSEFPISNVQITNEARTISVVSDRNGIADLSDFEDGLLIAGSNLLLLPLFKVIYISIYSTKFFLVVWKKILIVLRLELGCCSNHHQINRYKYLVERSNKSQNITTHFV